MHSKIMSLIGLISDSTSLARCYQPHIEIMISCQEVFDSFVICKPDYYSYQFMSCYQTSIKLQPDISKWKIINKFGAVNTTITTVKPLQAPSAVRAYLACASSNLVGKLPLQHMELTCWSCLMLWGRFFCSIKISQYLCTLGEIHHTHSTTADSGCKSGLLTGN